MMVNVAMWARAVRVIPRISREEWEQLDVVSRWLIATRSAVLVMTFVSAALAGLLAWRDHAFDVGGWLLLTVGLLLAHATNNLVNDITDHWKGVDRDNYFRAQYGPQPLEHGLLTTGQMLQYVGVTGALALVAGLTLVFWRGEAVLWLTAIGAFFVLFYTWPLKYIGLGEVAVLVVWGPLMVGGGYYVVTGTLAPHVLWASLPVALMATTVLFGKHIDKIEADRAKNIRTLPVILGERNARYAVIGLCCAAYAVTLYLVASRAFHWPLLLSLGSLSWFRLVFFVFREPRPASPPAGFPPNVWPLWYSAFAFQHTRRFGGLFLCGVLLDGIWSRWLG
ncbi:MAG: 1,4-dihydroxy-2-naphthoate octaprenyltransferase [Candidatus Binatia bacterium]|nr:MAG: 1,4-dihydroxy-2-naphthoate octaprenyltransferase [Candidatus Binatia bacterium]